MSLRLTVLGADGTYAGAGGACSGYLVRSDDTAIWLDAGPGTLANLQAHIDLADLDAVVVSHEHPDHCGELPVLRNALRYVLERRDVPVITTAGTIARVEAMGGPAQPTFAWDTVTDGDERTVGDLRLRFTRTDHPVETLAVRFDAGDGTSLAYTADTAEGISPRALAPDGRGVDLAVIEATFDEAQANQAEDRPPHLTGVQAGELATRAAAGNVLVTHLTPGTDAAARLAEVATAYGGRLDIAASHDTHPVVGGNQDAVRDTHQV